MKNKQIKLVYKEKEYILEFDRKSVSALEDNGFVASEFANKPAKMLPLAFKGAFFKHHKFIKEEIIDEIFDNIKNKEGLISELSSMITDQYLSLYGQIDDEQEDNEGNAMWEIVK